MTRLTLDTVYDLSHAALTGSGAIPDQAGPVAQSVREAEAEGIRNVGLGYLPIYCEHLRCGKVKGDAVPRLIGAAPAVLRVDAANGFCHPAFLLALPRFVAMAEASGIAALAITRSYSAGVVGWFVERMAGIEGVQAIEDAVRALQAETNGPVVVAVDGHSASGKSTFAAALATRLAAAVVHVDDFYRDMPEVDRLALSASEGISRYFDWERLRAEALVPLAAGRPARSEPAARHASRQPWVR